MNTKPLANGYLLITPDPGKLLYNSATERYYSEALVKETSNWRSVFSDVRPKPSERTLDDAKAEKLDALSKYDASPSVNAFTLSGVSMWIAPADRANYLLTLEGAKRQGVENVSFLGQTIPVDAAIQMLDAVNLYAMQCVGVTEAHRIAIDSLDTIDAVDGYDFTIGYPHKISF